MFFFALVILNFNGLSLWRLVPRNTYTYIFVYFGCNNIWVLFIAYSGNELFYIVVNFCVEMVVVFFFLFKATIVSRIIIKFIEIVFLNLISISRSLYHCIFVVFDFNVLILFFSTVIVSIRIEERQKIKSSLWYRKIIIG